VPDFARSSHIGHSLESGRSMGNNGWQGLGSQFQPPGSMQGGISVASLDIAGSFPVILQRHCANDFDRDQ
jgi:hypothetical protein